MERIVSRSTLTAFGSTVSINVYTKALYIHSNVCERWEITCPCWWQEECQVPRKLVLPHLPCSSIRQRGRNRLWQPGREHVSRRGSPAFPVLIHSYHLAKTISRTASSEFSFEKAFASEKPFQ